MHITVNQHLDDLLLICNYADAFRKLMAECLSWFTATSKLSALLVQLTKLLDQIWSKFHGVNQTKAAAAFLVPACPGNLCHCSG